MKRILEYHRFFLRESYPYSGVSFWRHPFRWLRAYVKFMRYSLVVESYARKARAKV